MTTQKEYYSNLRSTPVRPSLSSVIICPETAFQDKMLADCLEKPGSPFFKRECCRGPSSTTVCSSCPGDFRACMDKSVFFGFLESQENFQFTLQGMVSDIVVMHFLRVELLLRF